MRPLWRPQIIFLWTVLQRQCCDCLRWALLKRAAKIPEKSPWGSMTVESANPPLHMGLTWASLWTSVEINIEVNSRTMSVRTGELELNPKWCGQRRIILRQLCCHSSSERTPIGVTPLKHHLTHISVAVWTLSWLVETFSWPLEHLIISWLAETSSWLAEHHCGWLNVEHLTISDNFGRAPWLTTKLKMLTSGKHLKPFFMHFVKNLLSNYYLAL